MNTFLLMAALREHLTPALAGLPLPPAPGGNGRVRRMSACARPGSG